MKRAFQFVVLCAVAFIATAAVAGERAWRFTNIDPPNSSGAIAYGIAPNGAVVGTFVDSSGRQHGFLLRDGEYTQIDYPGAGVTEARGIAPDGTIVGSFRYPGEPAIVSRGFVLTPEGDFRPANYPGHISTIPQRVMPDGTILGCYHDTDMMATMRGIAMAPDGNSEIDLFGSMTNGSTPSGHVLIGLFFDMDAVPPRQRGFIIDNGESTGFDYPGATTTAAWDMNARGSIVGVYRDTAGALHGFILEAGEFSAIDYPGAARGTRTFGINARGDIVGQYIDASNRSHAYTATRTAKHNHE